MGKELENKKIDYYTQCFLDLFQVPPGQGAKQAEIISIDVEPMVYDQIKSQINRGKTVLTATKPDGDPQMWVIGHPFFSASVRKHELPMGLYMPDGQGGFTKKEKPASKIITLAKK